MAQATSNAPSGFTSRTTPPSFLNLPVNPGSHIYQGRPIAVNASGVAVPVTAGAGLRFVGFSQQEVDNSGSLTPQPTVNYSPPGNPDSAYYDLACVGATQAWVGQIVFWVDDQTVALSAANSVICGLVTGFLSSTQVEVNTAIRA